MSIFKWGRRDRGADRPSAEGAGAPTPATGRAAAEPWPATRDERAEEPRTWHRPKGEAAATDNPDGGAAEAGSDDAGRAGAKRRKANRPNARRAGAKRAGPKRAAAERGEAGRASAGDTPAGGARSGRDAEGGPRGKGKKRKRKGAGRAESPASRWANTDAARQYTMGLAALDAKGLPDITRLDWAAHFAAGSETPRRVVQFWDRSPPDEIRRLFDQVELICRKTGYEHVVYDLEGARARIAAMADPVWLKHFDDAFHPSMQADIFRVLELYHHGGTYVDADMTLVRPIPYAPPTVPLFAQWVSETRQNVANWFLSSPPNHPAFAAILQRIGENLATAKREADGSFVKSNLLKLTGPAIVARAVEDYLGQHRGEPVAAVMPVKWCHSFVAPARAFTHAPQYKREGLHWRREATS
ncbi:hypothetical protein DLJ53_21245 [Acuticoccus sediminis]|uniref:Glycosyltransferase sugar-binding region containing DXD motif-containing protein n=1 Tax=Acuticoccus sediminis TaxID=2184697 RepID=A0A8B2NSU7_9HYPH|nr:glycosyltransferase [Acuticoccus sediminis]RAI00234.1 hypothetical protein DLJ53_21245 [Acuticoccus sediminis]